MLKFRMLNTKAVLDDLLKQMPHTYRDVKLVPLSAEGEPGGSVVVASPYRAVEVPALTIKQLSGLAHVAGREFDPVSLISLCPKCNTLARVYIGMDSLGEATVRKFDCASCAHSDSEPMG